MTEFPQHGGVLMVNMPQLLRDVVRGVIDDAPDMEVVGEVPGSADVCAAIARTGARLVVTGSAESIEASWRDVLERNPRLRIVSVVDDGREARLYAMRPHRVLLGAVSPGILADALRGTAVL